MRSDSAAIFITKLGAAERQLSTAIRMYLKNEDELAVHTVGAAAYQVLRDLIGKDKHDDAHELFLTGLFSIAQELATGKPDAIPASLAHPSVIEIVEVIRCGIADGTITDVKDIATIHDQSYFWKKFNAPANFLKHANEDPSGVLDLSTIKNEELLMRAAGLLIRFTKSPTPEISALIAHLEK